MVGGSAVENYTDGRYATIDIDFVSRSPITKEIMKALGYKEVEGRYFYRTDIDSLVEFPGSNLDGDLSMVIVREIVPNLPLHIIGIEDLILDRIDQWVASRSEDTYEWCLRLMGAVYSKVNWSYLHREANKRRTLKEVEKCQRTVKRYKQLYEDLSK